MKTFHCDRLLLWLLKKIEAKNLMDMILSLYPTNCLTKKFIFSFSQDVFSFQVFQSSSCRVSFSKVGRNFHKKYFLIKQSDSSKAINISFYFNNFIMFNLICWNLPENTYMVFKNIQNIAPGCCWASLVLQRKFWIRIFDWSRVHICASFRIFWWNFVNFRAVESVENRGPYEIFLSCSGPQIHI